MASTVLDVRDTFASPHARAPHVPAVASTPTKAARRRPVTVLTAGALGITEAVALLSVGLTGLDGVLTSSVRPPGMIIAVGLVVLAAWIVLVAAGGAGLIDGTGKRLTLAVAYGELGIAAMFAVVAMGTPLLDEPPLGLPLPALLALALAVPVGKLLLVDSSSAKAWIAAGPRTRERRPDPVALHRGAATLTLAAIAFGLVALVMVTPVPGSGPESASTVYQP